MIYVSRIGLLTLALALVATVTFAAAEGEEAAAAEKEMVLDPSTGEMVEAPRYGGTLSYARPGAAEHCDVWSISGFATFFIGPVVEKLVIGDWAIGRSEHNWRSYNVPFSVMRGQLAESWETPDDTTIIVKVRPGVYWHDKPPMNGRELTASDIEFNYHRLLGLGSGFSEPTPFSWTLPAVESVTATDKSTVVFKLTRPDLFGVRKAFDTWDTWIYPPEVIQQHGDIKDCRNLVGTGPMELTDLVEGSSMTWTRVPDYWGFDEKFPDNRLPYVDELNALIMPDAAARIAALRSGQLDMLATFGDSQMRSLDQVESLRRTDPDIRMWEIAFRSDNAFSFVNQQNPPFDDIRVRRAMQMALDPETIANTYFKGMADPTPQGMIHSDNVGTGTPFDEWPEEVKQYYRYDPERAKQLLAEAGYPDGFKTRLDYGNRFDANYAELVIGYWGEIGVDVELSVKPGPEMVAIQRGHTTDGMMHFSSAATYADAGTLKAVFTSRSTSNFGNINDPDFDALIERAEAATTLEERNRLTKEANLYAIAQHWEAVGPTSPQFNVAQPWVKGYNGEISLGMQGQFLTLTARVWIDQDLKREMGF